MRSRHRTAAAAGLVALTSLAWLDPHQAVRDANRLYAEGKYEEAAAAYNAALIDRPDSAELHFNLGDATYKQGKYEEAVSAFQKVETAGDPARAGRVAYNAGNAIFRQGQALEQSEPQKALTLWAQALASYRRALGVIPDDEDVKFNHELVAKRIEDLKKKLEEQKKEHEQQPQDQNQENQEQQDQQQQDQQQQDQAQDEQQDQPEPEEQEGGDQQDQKPEAQEQAEQPPQEPPSEQQQDAQQGGEKQAPEQPAEPAGGEAVAGEQQEGELSKGEAAAILDSQRGEEVSPEDIIRKLQGARVAEPAEDW